MEFLSLIVIAALVAILSIAGRPKRRARRRRGPRALERKSGFPETAPYTVTGKAYVTDGDGIRVSGREIRLAGLDAPEWNQPAKHQDGYWYPHGERVKSALIRKVGGRQVHVAVEDHDRFGRAIGVVTCKGEDIGEWLVREGHAIAAYSERYGQVEAEAKNAKRGMWAHAANIDPRRWRHRKPKGG